MSGLWLASYLVLWVLLLVMAVALVSMLRNVGELAEAVKRLHVPRDTVTLQPGKTAPVLALTTADESTVATAAFTGTPTTYAVISPGCGPCRSFIEAIGADLPLEVFPATMQRVIISTAPLDADNGAAIPMLPPDVTVLFDTDNRAAAQWGARSTPTFITLDADGRYLKHTIGFTPLAVPAGA